MPRRRQFFLRVWVHVQVQVRDQDAAGHHARPLGYGVEIAPVMTVERELGPPLPR
jgi:hypothetical protein